MKVSAEVAPNKNAKYFVGKTVRSIHHEGASGRMDIEFTDDCILRLTVTRYEDLDAYLVRKREVQTISVVEETEELDL